ncbi:hypothetical protein ACIRVF_28155 [Kitasatospora sp. NPDC101157]|uniref:hypothetical protein n=1 Tax=Kitasatospora sp. NPDC101157 TaxID=3364098 RepID=UPI00380450EE
MVRSGRLPALDEDAAHLVAVGVVRLGAREWLGATGVAPGGALDGAAGGAPGRMGGTPVRTGGATGGAPGWTGGLQAASFADAWLSFGDIPAPGLRLPASAVLPSVAELAAELLLRSCGEDAPTALAWLGLRSAETRERADREGLAHPAEPCALALVWHGVQALTAGDGAPDHRRRIEERGEAYVRERHRRQDTLALLLGCARIAAAALVELSEGDPQRVDGWLEQDAARAMPRGGPVPLWVPGRPGQPVD